MVLNKPTGSALISEKDRELTTWNNIQHCLLVRTVVLDARHQLSVLGLQNAGF